MNYFDAYYHYLEGCRQFNQFECPESGWEEHHILPQSLFKGLGPTIFLSPEQHAKVSVLQSLAFNHNCTCTWMRDHVSSNWWKLVEQIRTDFFKEISKIPHVRGTAFPFSQTLTKEQRRRNGRKTGEIHTKSGHIQSIAYLGGLAGGKKGSANTNSQLWEDPLHPELGAHHFNRLAAVQRSNNLPHSKENRRKIQ